MTLQLKASYWDDEVARAEFIRLTREVHGLDLSAWRDHGFWDDDFVPFSYFVDGRMVSSACVYMLPMVIAGERCVVPQVSTVATDPEFRRQGLGKALVERAINWASDRSRDRASDPASDRAINLASDRASDQGRGQVRDRASDWATKYSFLFADQDAFSFYNGCRFRRVAQHRFIVKLPPRTPGHSARLLDYDNRADIDLLAELADGRTPVSDEIGCLSTKLLMFHALYRFRECSYWIGDLGVVVIASIEGRTLRVYDVVGPRVPPLDELLSYLPEFAVEDVELMFMPDKICPACEAVEQEDDPDGTHIGGSDFPYENRPFRFPMTAHA